MQLSDVMLVREDLLELRCSWCSHLCTVHDHPLLLPMVLDTFHDEHRSCGPGGGAITVRRLTQSQNR